MRSVLAAKHAQEKAELRDRQKGSRERMRPPGQAFPRFEQWLRENGSQELAEQWRYRAPEALITPASPSTVTEPWPPARDIRDFVAQARGWQVAYRRSGAPAGRASFIDHGKRIDIYDLDRNSVLAALQLASAKWGAISVTGNDDYKRVCVQLAVEQGLRIVNPELQDQLVAERDRRHPPRPPAPEDRLVHERQPAALVTPRGSEAPEAARTSTAPGPAPVPPPRDLAEVYRRHFTDVARQLGDRGDVSRLDGLVAVRMRLTGHRLADVAQAIREGAPKVRNEERDWSAYGQRAAAFAFSIPGQRQLEQLAPARERLLGVEGRAPRPEPELSMPPRRGHDLDR